MRKQIFALLTITVSAFAAPVSEPGNVNDTPIVSNGGGATSSSQCVAYQTDGTAVNLSGGEVLVFYGGGTDYSPNYRILSINASSTNTGGYLSTKSTYSGTAYVRVLNKRTYLDNYMGVIFNISPTLGLFTRNSTSQADFIAGAGTSGVLFNGGGWVGESFRPSQINYIQTSVYSGTWFSNGFHGSYYFPPDNSVIPSPFYYAYRNYVGYPMITGGASSVSAFYNYYTKQYTLLPLSYTLTGGGLAGYTNPILYVCK